MANKIISMPLAESCLPGRQTALPIINHHAVLHVPMMGEFPETERVLFAMGCFWGAEKQFWSIPGVVTTAVGYAAGHTPNPTYQEVCTGQTAHAEVVLVVYDPMRLSFKKLLQIFWENHDPTQGMQQGGDVGTQYRSGIYVANHQQEEQALSSRDLFQQQLTQAGFGGITTEILPMPEFYYAEDYHQQYLAKNPQGYCGLGGTGISCSIGPMIAVKD